MFTTGRKPRPKPKPRAKGRAGLNTPTMRRDSATPGANGIGSRPRLSIKPPKDDSGDPRGMSDLAVLPPDQDTERQAGHAMEEEDELPTAQGARRSGRVIKSTHHDDFMYDSDAVIDLSSVGKADDNYAEGGSENLPSSPRK